MENETKDKDMLVLGSEESNIVILKYDVKSITGKFLQKLTQLIIIRKCNSSFPSGSNRTSGSQWDITCSNTL